MLLALKREGKKVQVHMMNRFGRTLSKHINGFPSLRGFYQRASIRDTLKLVRSSSDESVALVDLSLEL
jgi:hypothetical protein